MVPFPADGVYLFGGVLSLSAPWTALITLRGSVGLTGDKMWKSLILLLFPMHPSGLPSDKSVLVFVPLLPACSCMIEAVV